MRVLFDRCALLACVGLSLAAMAGCSGGPLDVSMPFAAKQKTSYRTPAKRMAELREWEEEGASRSEAEQQKVAADLARLLPSEPDPLVREQILRTLSRLSTPLARSIPLAGLKDEDPQVRILACEIVSQQKSPEALAALGEVVQSDTNIDVRLAATRTLGRFNDPSAVPALAAALEDDDPALQYRAVETLRTVTGRDLGNDVGAWREFVRSGTPPNRKPESVADRLLRWRPF